MWIFVMAKSTQIGRIGAFCRRLGVCQCGNNIILARSLLLSILKMGGYIDIGEVSG